MILKSQKIPELADNIVIEIPMTEEGIRAIRVICEINIKTTVTIIFSTNQALLAVKAGATYISIFVGRLDGVKSRN